MAPQKGKQRAGTAPIEIPDPVEPGTTSTSEDFHDQQPRQQPSLLERINAATTDQLVTLLEEEQMEEESEEWKTIQTRIRQYKTLVGLQDAMRQEQSRKRTRDDDDDDNENLRGEEPKWKRREVKYTNISKLTPRTTPRKFAEWKSDMKRLLRGAPEKYRLSSMKMVAAHEYMDEKAKSLWASHERLHPEDEDDWDKFLQWATCLIAQ